MSVLFSLTITSDLGNEHHNRHISNLCDVARETIYLKPWSLIACMKAKRHLCYLDDRDFERACGWVENGDVWSPKEPRHAEALAFIIARAIDVLGIQGEQWRALHPHLVADIEADTVVLGEREAA